MAGKAFVTKPAPDFEVEALLESEEFEKVKLSDYKGEHFATFSLQKIPFMKSQFNVAQFSLGAQAIIFCS